MTVLEARLEGLIALGISAFALRSHRAVTKANSLKRTSRSSLLRSEAPRNNRIPILRSRIPSDHALPLGSLPYAGPDRLGGNGCLVGTLLQVASLRRPRDVH